MIHPLNRPLFKQPRENIRTHAQNTQPRCCGRKSSSIPWLILVGPQPRSIDTTGVSYGIDECDSDRTLGCRLWNHIGDPGLDQRRAPVNCAEGEDSKDILRHAVLNDRYRNEEDTANAREDADQRPLRLELVGEVAGTDNIEEGGCVRGNGVILTRWSGPPERLHERRNKVLHCLGASDKNEKQTLCPDAPVAHGHFQGDPVRNLLASSALCESNAVDSEAVACENHFFLGEETLAVRGVIGHEEENDDGAADGRNSFENLIRVRIGRSLQLGIADTTYKKPPPTRKPRDTIHVIGYNASKEPRNRAGDRHRCVEDRIASCQLISAVPRGEEERTAWGKSSLKLMVRTARSRNASQTYLSKTNEESHASKLLPVLHRAHEGGKRAPEKPQTG
jgi:hypothetical protein